MKNYKRSELSKAAEELNEVLLPTTPMDPKGDPKQLEEMILEAAGLLEPTDVVSPETKDIINRLLRAKEEGEKEPKKKEKPKEGKAVPSHNGSMAEFMDSVLNGGGGWEGMVTEIKAEATKRGLGSEKFTVGTVRAHAKYRLSKGKLNININPDGVTPK